MGERDRFALLKIAHAKQEAVATSLVDATPIPQTDDAELSEAWLAEFIRRAEFLGHSFSWIRLAIAAQLNGRFVAAWTLKREGIPIVPVGMGRVVGVASFADYADLEAAAAYWKTTVPLTDSEYEQILADLRAFAADAAAQTGLVAERIIETAATVLREAFEKSWTLSQFRKEFAERIGSVAKHTLESMYRTTISRRYGQFRGEAIRRAGTQIVPFLQYLSIPDARRTPICKALHRFIAAADAEFWDEFTPPNHWQCRSDVSPIPYTEALRMGIVERDETGKIRPTRGAFPYGLPPKTTIDDETGEEVEVIPQIGFRTGQKHSARRVA